MTDTAESVLLAEAVKLLSELRQSLDGQGYVRLNAPGSEEEWLQRRRQLLFAFAKLRGSAPSDEPARLE